MKSISYSIIIFICSILLVACSSEDTLQKVSENTVKVYCTDTNETQLFWEYYELKGDTVMEQLEELLQVLETPPEDQAYKCVKPEDVTIKELYFGEDRQLIINFSASYTNMDKIPELLCRAAIIKTLCQVEGVEYVEFYINGQSLALTGEVPLGQMTAGDFIDNTGDKVEFTQTVNMTVYFADRTGQLLLESLLVVENDGSRTMEQLVMEQLVNGPLDEQTDMCPVIPDGTVVNKMSTNDGICYIDLNEEFMKKRENLTDEIAVYAVVNSLVELPNISKVQFTINGEQKKVYNSLDMTVLFERRPDLIANERAGE